MSLLPHPTFIFLKVIAIPLYRCPKHHLLLLWHIEFNWMVNWNFWSLICHRNTENRQVWNSKWLIDIIAYVRRFRQAGSCVYFCKLSSFFSYGIWRSKVAKLTIMLTTGLQQQNLHFMSCIFKYDPSEIWTVACSTRGRLSKSSMEYFVIYASNNLKIAKIWCIL